ncbi:MAG: hypothetical protein ISP01_03855 [Methanobrevibacter arboriphilus]|jgi:hypothetical protein|uniref:Uncharacterized protein n=2 Tax=Methanobrevibacter arboriphilus TaxID=39441 RepID=A0A843AHA3_METAZ|nr:hypothetical protein [Methanobrevibacter arboriphilus]MBF4468516.1 hypothetical protein [Methanobrevibacter arboriphilus]MCC7562160.1 hypothetical protein [Methanobrevibacter arboriphilus]BBL61141.1 hypothetical protein MarbSA_01810 [Methanobrevibacter arboriphilus]GLI12264.1 hypothetical protein MARBORIA2_13540 [Methanobrevibacter arboriphilus]
MISELRIKESIEYISNVSNKLVEIRFAYIYNDFISYKDFLRHKSYSIIDFMC